jgi:hypothetical protein
MGQRTARRYKSLAKKRSLLWLSRSADWARPEQKRIGYPASPNKRVFIGLEATPKLFRHFERLFSIAPLFAANIRRK